MESDDDTSLNKDHGTASKEVSSLRSELTKLNSTKETSFNKRDEITQKRKALILEINKLKEERDALNISVKANKEKREQVNTQIKQKIDEIKAIEKDVDKIKKSTVPRQDPERVKSQIEKLEYRLETDVQSFEKEKELMKEINSLRKIIDSSKGFSTLMDKKRVVQKEINELRKSAEELHKKIQVDAEESQKRHERLIAISNEIGELKKQEDAAHQESMKLKEKFNVLNDQLKDKVSGYADISHKVEAAKEEHNQKKRAKTEDIMKRKEQEIEDKIRRGEKLTTEDLRVFQHRPE